MSHEPPILQNELRKDFPHTFPLPCVPEITDACIHLGSCHFECDKALIIVISKTANVNTAICHANRVEASLPAAEIPREAPKTSNRPSVVAYLVCS